MATQTEFVLRYSKSQPTKSSKIKHALSSRTKSGDFIGRQNWAIFAWHMTDFYQAILSADKIGRFCRSSDFPFNDLGDLSWPCIPVWCAGLRSWVNGL